VASDMVAKIATKRKRRTVVDMVTSGFLAGGGESCAKLRFLLSLDR
jgi:hypothetical protein